MRALLLCFFMMGAAHAASPSATLVLPRGGQRGTDVVVTIQGANLADTQEVVLYYPGITVRSINSVKPNEVKATLSVAPDCRLGEHAIRLRTASGLSDLRTFWVGALPSVDEREPNNSFETAQPISMNVTVQGRITNEDADYFAVDGVKGQRLSVEIEGMRLGSAGSGFFDPTVTIYNENKFELAVADDAYITGQDGGTSIVIPADGRYYVMVRDSAYGGRDTSFYRLHVGNFPRPTAVVPAGGRPGETLEVRFIGDPLGEIKQIVTLPKDNLNLARLHASNDSGIHPAGIKVRVNDLPPIAEGVNVSTLKTAGTITIPCAVHGTLQVPGELDYFKFKAAKGQVLDFACYARRLGSPVDPVIYLDRIDGEKAIRVVQMNDDNDRTPDASMRVTIPEDGEYCLRVHDHLLGGSPTHFYRVEIRPPTSSAALRLPYVDTNNTLNQERQSWIVPKGGRIALPMQVRRSDWDGPANVVLDGLPNGVTATIEPVDFATNIVPVIIEAKADAPNGTKLIRPRLQPLEKPVAEFDTTMVDVALSAAGGGQGTYHTLPVEHVPVVVTDAAPFRIDVVEPKVPLVQNGSMQIRVVATRAAGFTGPITVQPVINVPGVGINGSTVIPENANECLVPISAAGNAVIKKWRLAFLATGNAGAGNVLVGTGLFTLDVTAPMVTLAQQRTAIEIGQSGTVVCKLTTNTPFAGKAKATLFGLPPKCTAAPIEFETGTAEIAFQVVTENGAPAGKHNTFVQVLIIKDGETVCHNLGGGELRLDAPQAAKAGAAPPKPATNTPKTLSRLEQLRKEQEEREKQTPPPVNADPKKP